MGAKDIKIAMAKESPTRAEQSAAPRFSFAHGESVSVRWPRSLKPLLMLGLFVCVVVATAVVMQAYNHALVRAPGVLYPVTQSPLRVPLSTYDQNACRVAEVYKREGETVQAGEKLLRLDSADKELQREQAQKRVQSCLEALKDYELQPKERGPRVQWAKVRVDEAKAVAEVEQARFNEATARLKRAGAAPAEAEIKAAQDRLKTSEQSEQFAQAHYEDLRLQQPKAGSDVDVRKASQDYEKHKAQTEQYRNELKLLQTADPAARLEGAQEQADYRRVALKMAQARVEVRRKEAQLLESAVDADKQQKALEDNLEKARLEERRINKAIEDRILRAPSSGVLHGFDVQNGQWVSIRDTLGWVCDTSSLLFCAQVQQRDLPRIRVGQRGRIYFNGPSGVNGAYEAEVSEIGEFLEASGNASGDPLGLFPGLLPRRPIPSHATVRLKVLGPIGGAPGEGSAGVSPACAGGALRPGCAGQGRILVGDGRIAEWFFDRRVYSAAPVVFYPGTPNKRNHVAAELLKKENKGEHLSAKPDKHKKTMKNKKDSLATEPPMQKKQ